MGSLIADNYIRATALCLNDASSDVQVINNRFISDANDDGSGAGAGALAVKCAILLASGNWMSTGDHRNSPFPIMGTLS
jgi:secreted trypsin-like serine protease